MDAFEHEPGSQEHRRSENVLDEYESSPSFQKMVRLGLLGIEYNHYDDALETWSVASSETFAYPRFLDKSNKALSVHRTRSLNSLRCFYPSALQYPHKTEDSYTEGKDRFFDESIKVREKAEKKRLKRKKQKERKYLEKSEKEKRNPVKTPESSDTLQQFKPEENIALNDESREDTASSTHTNSSINSENESSDKEDNTEDPCNSEELDLTSSFVNRAALIAQRKLGPKSKSVRTEKMRVKKHDPPEKAVAEKSNEEVAEKALAQESAASSHIFDDNIKKSADLALIGNQFASVGDFNMAVKYFTDAIKYNPTEYKLFGNRAFCFEKMQEYGKALADAKLSLSIFPNGVRALFRKGRALAGLKRYDEAAQAFRDILKLDSSCAEAARELMQVQITQLMEKGFTQEQSTNALIIHGTTKKALEVLSKLNQQPGISPLAPGPNGTQTSPDFPASLGSLTQDTTKIPVKSNQSGPAPNLSCVKDQPMPLPNAATETYNQDSKSQPELFPVWVGNLVSQVTRAMIHNLFNEAGEVYNVKVLAFKRCAFVNFTKQEFCDEAIKRFNGFAWMGNVIAVRYPDRIPQGMGFSKSALKANDLRDENSQHSASRCFYRRPYKSVLDN